MMGGKSFAAPSGIGPWIATHLPYRQGYIEPFAGMLGILLNRHRSNWEIANDLDNNIYNWWVTIRDHADTLAEYLALTPQRSRQSHLWAITNLTEGNQIERAAAFTILTNSCLNTLPATATPGRYLTFRGSWPPRLTTERIWELAERAADLELENIDAIDLLNRTSATDSVVIYCDPPYPSSVESNRSYSSAISPNRLVDTLIKQKGYVAISGYSQDWNVLSEDHGWTRCERRSRAALQNYQSTGQDRTEVIWCNHLPPTGHCNAPYTQPTLLSGQ